MNKIKQIMKIELLKKNERKQIVERQNENSIKQKKFEKYFLLNKKFHLFF